MIYYNDPQCRNGNGHEWWLNQPMGRLWIFTPATSRDQESVWNPLHNPNKVGRSAIHICIVDARRAHRQLATQEIVEHGLCPVSIESHLSGCPWMPWAV